MTEQKTKICVVCGTEFTPHPRQYTNALYCSARCRSHAKNTRLRDKREPLNRYRAHLQNTSYRRVYCLAENIEEASRLVRHNVKLHEGFTLEPIKRIPSYAWKEGTATLILRQEAPV